MLLWTLAHSPFVHSPSPPAVLNEHSPSPPATLHEHCPSPPAVLHEHLSSPKKVKYLKIFSLLSGFALWILLLSLLAIWWTGARARPAVLDERLEFASLRQSFGAEVCPDGSCIQLGDESPIRWSSFGSPTPKYVINVATEQDTARVVSFLYLHSIPFLAQNGGSGWIPFDKNITVVINLARLNQFSPNADRTLTTIGGGLSINDTLPAAWNAGVQVQTGNCPCLGVLGANLGGGYGDLMGLYGFGADNIVSLRLVTPQGHLVTVSQESDPDLFWALRGSAPNLGIVTSAVIKSYPVPHSESFAWTGNLVFDQAHLEDVVTAIGNLHLQPKMNVFMYFISLGGPPVVLTTPFLYQGTNESFRKAFASLYAIPYLQDTTARIDYKNWNDAVQGFCARGDRKPSYGAGYVQLVPQAWRNIWNEYIKFQAEPGAERSIVLLEVYSLIKARSIPANQQGSFPHRDLSFNSVAIPWYTNSSLDAKAQSFGEYARDQWRASSGLAGGRNATYVNFAHGDEDNEVVYGSSLPRLQKIKRRVDPTNVMRHWFDIKA